MTPGGDGRGAWSRRPAVQWVILALTLVGLGIGTAMDLWLDFRYHRQHSLERLESQTKLIGASLERQLDAIDFALGNLQAVLGQASQSGINQASIGRHLELVGHSLRGVRTLSVVNGDGIVMASDRGELVGRNFRHRDYFQTAQATPDAAWLYVTPPFTTALGVYSIGVARALVGADGRFAGVVVATLDPAFFSGLLEAARYAEDMQVVVAHAREGIFQAIPLQAADWSHDLLASDRKAEDSSGLRIVEMGGVRRVVVAGIGRTSNMAPADGLRVMVSRDLRAVEAASFHEGAVKLGLYSFIVLISVVGLAYWQRWQRLARAERAGQEQALRDSERFMRTVADHVPGMVAYWTPDLRCAFANQAYLEWFGRHPDMMIGMRMHDLLGDELFGMNRPFIEGVLRGEPQRFERALVKADGTQGYTWAQYIPDCQEGEVRGFLVLVSDITEVKQAQLALEQANTWLLEEMTGRRAIQEELEQTNAALQARTAQAEEASAARSRFLASVSHELRTPLHTVLGYIGLLRKDISGEAGEYLSLVEHGSAQLLKLIDELLEFSRGMAQEGLLQPETVGLRLVLARLVETARLLAAPRGNRFTAIIADGLPAAVTVDEQRLVQVLQNLIGNACKYTRDGEIWLRVETDEDCADRLAGTCRLRFSVEDTGSGIAPTDLPYIFDAFARGAAAAHQPGLGLGLAIAQHWVRAMGSEIEVSSVPGKGSRFWFSLALPVAIPGDEKSAPCLAYAEALCGAGATVLVVDDILGNRLILRDMCRRWGLAVVEAVDGEDGLAACRAEPAIAAILVDQLMPRMDGWEFLRRLRLEDAWRHLPVVLVSASPAERPAGFPEGVHFDLALGKPIEEEVLGCFLCRRLVRCRPDACLWPSVAPEPELPPDLPSEKLAEFLAMVDRGRVEALAEWAGSLAAASSAHADFCRRVVGYCRAADLAELERLAQGLRTKCP